VIEVYGTLVVADMHGSTVVLLGLSYLTVFLFLVKDACYVYNMYIYLSYTIICIECA